MSVAKSIGSTFSLPLMVIFLKFERERQAKMLQNLLQKDRALGGTGRAILHKGHLWHIEPINKLRGTRMEAPREELVEELEILGDMASELEQDEKKLRQALSVVLGRCHTIQDVRDVLPEALVGDVSQFNGLRRTRPEGFLLQELPALKQQFDQAVELALKYAANRLIF